MLSLSHLGISIEMTDKTSFALIKAVKRCSHPLVPGLPASARASCSLYTLERRQQKLAVQCLVALSLAGSHTVKRALISPPDGWRA